MQSCVSALKYIFYFHTTKTTSMASSTLALSQRSKRKIWKWLVQKITEKYWGHFFCRFLGQFLVACVTACDSVKLNHTMRPTSMASSTLALSQRSKRKIWKWLVQKITEKYWGHFFYRFLGRFLVACVTACDSVKLIQASRHPSMASPTSNLSQRDRRMSWISFTWPAAVKYCCRDYQHSFLDVICHCGLGPPPRASLAPSRVA